METDPRQYEIAYVINGEIPEEDAFGIAGKVTSLIQDAHGMLGRIDEPKKRKLAYPINDALQGYFGCTTFTIHPEFVPTISEKLRGEKGLFRVMITEEVKRPVATFRPRHDRPTASGDGGSTKAFLPQAPKEENPEMIAALDKKLDEIFGDEISSEASGAVEPAPAAADTVDPKSSS